MLTPYIFPARRQPLESPLGPPPITPVQALQKFFEPASHDWQEAVLEQLPPFRGRRARDIMHPGVITVRPETPISQLVALLREKDISGVPVVDSLGVPVGVVSLTDVATFVGQGWVKANQLGRQPLHWEEEMSDSLGSTPVSEIMSPFLYFASSDADLDQLADLMLEHHIHRVIILSENEIVGIVSGLDIIKAYRSLE